MHGAFWVLLLSGILGFRVGMLGFPDWQVAVETAQVVGGLVPYPPDNVFYIYHTRLWTVLHQLLALGLRAGVSELTLSLIVSGVQGMLTFQALALFVYALSRDILLAIGAAALIFFTRSAEYGTVYPLFLLGTEHTYGVVGLSTGVLAVAMLGAGWYRAGALLLGMAPCIHPSLGSWTALAVFLAVLSDFRSLRVELRAALPWFLAGCGVTARKPADPLQPRTRNARGHGAPLSRGSFDVRQALGRTPRGRQHLARRRDAERRVVRRRVRVAPHGPAEAGYE